MGQIEWCMQQKKGIELVEPSDTLRDAYLMKAEEALEVLHTTTVRDWQLIVKHINNGTYRVFY